MRFILSVLNILMLSPMSFAMVSIPYFEQHHIRYRAERHLVPETDERDRIGNISYQTVKVGPLSETQFDLLKARYQAPLTLQYNPGRVYGLTEFLSPLIQALDTHHFHGYTESVVWRAPKEIESIFDNNWPGQELSVEARELLTWAENREQAMVVSNSWSAAYSILRDIREHTGLFEFGLIGRPTALTKLTNSDDFDEVDENDVRYGDVLTLQAVNPVSGVYQIEHSAIMIEPNLVFELTGGWHEDMFRFSSLPEAIRPSRARFGSGLKVVFTRLKPQKMLSPISEFATTRAFDARDQEFRAQYGLPMERPFYGQFLPPETLDRLIIGLQWSRRGHVVESALSLAETIRVVCEGPTCRYQLDPENKISKHFFKEVCESVFPRSRLF